MTVVSELSLATVDLTGGELSGDTYHERLAGLAGQGEFGWLATSPLAFIVLDRESAEFFLRSRATAFPGREIADLFGVTSGRLREQIDANILNQQGDAAPPAAGPGRRGLHAAGSRPLAAGHAGLHRPALVGRRGEPQLRVRRGDLHGPIRR